MSILTRKSIIIDIRKIKNKWELKSNLRLKQVLDVICEYNELEIVEKIIFDRIIKYILIDSSHVTIQAFPENDHIAFDFYFSGEYKTDDFFELIFDFLVQAYDANPLWSSLQIVERNF